MNHVTLIGKLLDERDDAIYILVAPNWDVWLPRSCINPKGGLRIKRADSSVSVDVVQWKHQKLVSDGKLPSMNPAVRMLTDESTDDPLEATDERFKRKGQEKT